jgi:hypothetical protein
MNDYQIFLQRLYLEAQINGWVHVAAAAAELLRRDISK